MRLPTGGRDASSKTFTSSRSNYSSCVENTSGTSWNIYVHEVLRNRSVDPTNQNIGARLVLTPAFEKENANNNEHGKSQHPRLLYRVSVDLPEYVVHRLPLKPNAVHNREN